MRSLRYSLPVLGLAMIGNLVAVVAIPFETSGVQVFRCLGHPYTDGDFRIANVIWTCPNPLRLALVSLVALLCIFLGTAAGYGAARREHGLPLRRAHPVRMACIGISVGALYLLGVYVSEYIGGEGKLNPFFALGAPVLVSLVHYPRWLGLVLAIPAMVAGFVGVAIISFVTGIPLD